MFILILYRQSTQLPRNVNRNRTHNIQAILVLNHPPWGIELNSNAQYGGRMPDTRCFLIAVVNGPADCASTLHAVIAIGHIESQCELISPPYESRELLSTDGHQYSHILPLILGASPSLFHRPVHCASTPPLIFVCFCFFLLFGDFPLVIVIVIIIDLSFLFLVFDCRCRT